jgi:hypothetical protein
MSGETIFSSWSFKKKNFHKRIIEELNICIFCAM